MKSYSHVDEQNSMSNSRKLISILCPGGLWIIQANVIRFGYFCGYLGDVSSPFGLEITGTVKRYTNLWCETYDLKYLS